MNKDKILKVVGYENMWIAYYKSGKQQWHVMKYNWKTSKREYRKYFIN